MYAMKESACMLEIKFKVSIGNVLIRITLIEKQKK